VSCGPEFNAEGHYVAYDDYYGAGFVAIKRCVPKAERCVAVQTCSGKWVDAMGLKICAQEGRVAQCRPNGYWRFTGESCADRCWF
jgi:hypothetical protein